MAGPMLTRGPRMRRHSFERGPVTRTLQKDTAGNILNLNKVHVRHVLSWVDIYMEWTDFLLSI